MLHTRLSGDEDCCVAQQIRDLEGNRKMEGKTRQLEQLDFSRVEHLLTPSEISDKKVTVVGLGSGGAPCVDHLAMNGVRNFDLYDPDTLDEVNLVKHPRRRRELGRPKVLIQKEWILDRNPQAKVSAFQEDVIKSQSFKKSVSESDLVLVCPDKKSVREYVNDQCIKKGTSFVVASVFRTGIGGQILGCNPGNTGCLRCLELVAMKNNMLLTDEQLGLTKDEEHKIYGLGDKEYRASGLSMDIQMIALIQARMALSYCSNRK